MENFLKGMLILCAVLGNGAAWAGKASGKKIADACVCLGYISLCPLCFQRLEKPGSMENHTCHIKKKRCPQCRNDCRTAQGRVTCFYYCSRPASWDLYKTRTKQSKVITQDIKTENIVSDNTFSFETSCEKIINNGTGRQVEGNPAPPFFKEPYDWG